LRLVHLLGPREGSPKHLGDAVAFEGHYNSHIHALVADGLFTDNGMFYVAPRVSTSIACAETETSYSVACAIGALHWW
jgi:hypothetical protein